MLSAVRDSHDRPPSAVGSLETVVRNRRRMLSNVHIFIILSGNSFISLRIENLVHSHRL